ncbi:hypothetical protein HOY80DRAFT_998276 [Tuber brumale]|nr:hypothetical protein HOY80DRAFT_998276 [Tuber brumale]
MILEVGAPHGHNRITCEKGQDAYVIPLHDKKKGNGFRIMVSPSISLGYKGPIWIWLKETAAERLENAEELYDENTAKVQRIEERRTRATIPGTEKYEYLQALNRNIDFFDANRGPTEPRRLHRHPYWEFRAETRCGITGGGMDWFLCRKHSLHE